MKKFDAKIEEILNENILGSIASTIGAGIEAAESPSKGFSRLLQTSAEKEKEAEKIKGQPINITNNKPKVGQFLAYESNKQITGKVAKLTDGKAFTQDGKFGISLVNPDGTPSEFEFVKTKDKPYWRIEYVNVVTDRHVSGKDIILKENNILQVSPTQEIPFVLVGMGTAFEKWIDYKSYIDGLNKK
jgi:hypothetical protein